MEGDGLQELTSIWTTDGEMFKMYKMFKTVSCSMIDLKL